MTHNAKFKRNPLIYGAISLLGLALLAVAGAWWWLQYTALDMSKPWEPHMGLGATIASYRNRLEELILYADVVARVRLLDVEERIQTPGKREAYEAKMLFKFEVLEYLKGGNGRSPSPIWGQVYLEQAEGDTEEEARWKAAYYWEHRTTYWDDREAIVFMDILSSNAPTPQHYALGGITADSGHPLETYSLSASKWWLPSASTRVVSGASDEQEFLLEYPWSGASGTSGASNSAATVSTAKLRRLASLSDAALERRINSLSGFMVVDESQPSETGIDHLSARTKANWIELSWQTSANAPDITGHRILRRKQTDSEFIQLADIPITEDGYYQDTQDIQPETKYIYRLRAYGAYGDIADARIAITTVAALEPLNAGATSTPTATPTTAPPATHTPAPTSTPEPTPTPSDTGGVSGAIDTPTPTPTSTTTPTLTPTSEPPPGGVTGQ